LVPQASLAIFRVRCEIERDADLGVGPYVYVQLNQGSLLDALFWGITVPDATRSIMNFEFALLPFLGWASAALQRLVLIRQWPAQSRRVMAKAEALLRRGTSIGVSIEGQRSPDGSLMPYKKGPVRLALATGTPIVPVFFEDARGCLPYGEWRVRPSTARIRLLAPVSVDGLTLDDRDAVVARLRAIAVPRLEVSPRSSPAVFRDSPR
jgi:1-acyl-sn-glycerol-3-phosphate acyltransferase